MRTSGTVLAPESAGVQWGEASGKGADLDCTPVRRPRCYALTTTGWLASILPPGYALRLVRVRVEDVNAGSVISLAKRRHDAFLSAERNAASFTRNLESPSVAHLPVEGGRQR